jgi:hypothetical protein
MVKEDKRELEARVWFVDAWKLLGSKYNLLGEFHR